MDEGIFQLIFLALVLVGWLIRAAAEQKQRRKQKRQPGETPEAPPVPPVEVPGTRPRGRPSGPRRPAAPTRPDQVLSGLESTSWAANIEAPDQSQVAERAARRRAARRLLAGGTDRPVDRDLARTGMLWSEVLGPCRALKGPHRPPHLARRR